VSQSDVNQPGINPDNQYGPTPLKDWLTFIAVVLAASVYAAAWTLPNAVLPQMQGDLSVNLDQVAWVVTATVVASAIGIPLTPWLSSRFGSRNLMIYALGTFSATSILVGTVNTIEEVVLWRVLSAFAGSPIIALSQAVTMNTFPAHKRAFVFSLWSVGMASGWVFAPTVGAWLADIVSWRLTFMSVAPFGFAALLFCIIFLPKDKPDTGMRFDWTGYLTLAVALTMAQIVVNQGYRLDWFKSTQLVILTGIGLISFYLYLIHTLHCKTPFLSWAIFRDRNLTCSVLITAIYAYSGLVPLVILPSMMEELRGVDVFTSGLIVLPRGIANMVGMILAGFAASRLDPRYLIAGGLATYSSTSWLMAHYNTSIGIDDVLWPTIIQGLSMGFIWVPAMGLMYATISSKLRTSAATMISLTYSLSSSFGVAIAVVILNRSQQINTAEMREFIEPARQIIKDSSIISDFSDPGELLAVAQEISLQALALGYANVYLVMAISALAIIPLAFLLRIPAKEPLNGI
jgi:DHA2 family multidrug resistance protein